MLLQEAYSCLTALLQLLEMSPGGCANCFSQFDEPSIEQAGAVPIFVVMYGQ